jgi:hypothetical protein
MEYTKSAFHIARQGTDIAAVVISGMAAGVRSGVAAEVKSGRFIAAGVKSDLLLF